MSGRWAVRLDQAEAAVAARLRQIPRVEVYVEGTGGAVWLRGPLDDALAEQIHALPAGERFQVLDDGQLIPWGGRVPHGTLPAENWGPLSGWFEPHLPLAALPGSLAASAKLELARDETEREPSLLTLDIPEWLAYVASAPQVRLDRWMFAVNSQGRVLVRGTPLPPLPGQRLVEEGGIVVPAGSWWSPPVDAAVLRRWFELAEGDLALLGHDGAWEKIEAGDFTRATRGAIRSTAAALDAGGKGAGA